MNQTTNTASIDLAQLDTDKLLERVNRLADWMQPIGKGSAEDLRMLIALARRSLTSGAPAEQEPVTIDTDAFRSVLGAYVGAIEAQETRRKIQDHYRSIVLFIDSQFKQKLSAGAAAKSEQALNAKRYEYVRATTTAIRDPETGESIECTPGLFDAAIDRGMSKSADAAENNYQGTESRDWQVFRKGYQHGYKEGKATTAGAGSTDTITMSRAQLQAERNECFRLGEIEGRDSAAGAGSAQPRAEGDERALYVKPWEQKVTERTGIERPCYRDWPNAVLDELLALRAALARAPLPAQSQPGIEVSAQGTRLPDGSFITPEGDVTGPLAEAIAGRIRAPLPARDLALTNDGREPDWDAYAAAEQAQPVDDARDAARLDWLNEQPVHFIELDDFSIIDVKGLDVREAIDAAMRANDSAAEEGNHG